MDCMKACWYEHFSTTLDWSCQVDQYLKRAAVLRRKITSDGKMQSFSKGMADLLQGFSFDVHLHWDNYDDHLSKSALMLRQTTGQSWIHVITKTFLDGDHDSLDKESQCIEIEKLKSIIHVRLWYTYKYTFMINVYV